MIRILPICVSVAVVALCSAQLSLRIKWKIYSHRHINIPMRTHFFAYNLLLTIFSVPMWPALCASSSEHRDREEKKEKKKKRQWVCPIGQKAFTTNTQTLHNRWATTGGRYVRQHSTLSLVCCDPFNTFSLHTPAHTHSHAPLLCILIYVPIDCSMLA